MVTFMHLAKWSTARPPFAKVTLLLWIYRRACLVWKIAKATSIPVDLSPEGNGGRRGEVCGPSLNGDPTVVGRLGIGQCVLASGFGESGGRVN